MRDLLRVVRAEWAYWRHTRALPFQIFVFFLVGFLVGTSEVVLIVGPTTPVYKNAPTAVIQGALVGLLFSLFAVSLFLGRSAARVFEEGLADWEFALPLSPRALFWGRFFGALALSLLVVLMLPVGIETGVHMPWVDPDKVGPIRMDAHLEALGGFILPGLLSVAALLYGMAFAFRSHRAAIAGGVGLFFLFILTDLILSNLNLERWAFWVDPFGLGWVNYAVRYWTPAELNHRLVPLSLPYGISRLLWVGLPLAWLAFLSHRFQMVLAPGRERRRGTDMSEPSPAVRAVLPGRPRQYGRFRLLLAEMRFSLRLLLTSWVFWVLVAVFGLVILANFMFAFLLGRGAHEPLAMPTTAGVLNLMSEHTLILVILLVAVFAGELVQGERERGVLEWTAVTPARPFALAARTLALLAAIVLVIVLFALAGVCMQVLLHTPIRWGLYAGWLLYILASPVIPYAALALFLHTLIPRKFLAHMLMVGVFLFLLFADKLGIEQAVFGYGFIPASPIGNLSDMAGFRPYFPYHLVWMLLWGLAAGVLLWKAWMFFRLPALEPLRWRIRGWKRVFHVWDGIALGVLGGAFLFLGVGIYRELYVRRPWMDRKTREVRSASYEKRFKHLELAPVPRLVHLAARMDLFPSRMGYVAHVRAVYINRDTLPVESLLVENLPSPPYTVENLIISRAHTVMDSGVYPWVALWRLLPPLLPGETLVVEADISCRPPLVTEDDPYACGVLPRGSLVHLTPPLIFGYDARKELSARRLRRKYGLSPEPVEIPPDTPRADFLGFPRFTFDLVVSLPARDPQTVVTGGMGVAAWEEGGRRFVRFLGDRPATWGLGGLTVAVAPYAKRVDSLEGIQVELYFSPDHRWNADTVLQGALAALRYHIRHYGSYPHPVLRIAEFPSLFGDYAQSLASFIPYGEGMGFLTRMREDQIPYPVFVIAHEVGHQWWAHQLTPAMVLGAHFLTESFSEYVAIRVMSEGRPPKVLARFLKHELDRYLRARQGAFREERPIVFSTSPAVYYQKGSVVTHATASLLGHETYAGILRELIAAFPDPPPHPSVRDYLERLYAQTPSELQPVLRDWHEEVVIYDLRARKAWREGDTLFLTLESQKFQVEGESEQAVAFYEPVDVGLFAGDSLLEVRRVWIRDGKHTYSLPSVPVKVERVEVDPFFERINRTWEEREVAVR